MITITLKLTLASFKVIHMKKEGKSHIQSSTTTTVLSQAVVTR